MADDAEVAAIERATFSALAPQAIYETAGWMVALDPGPIRRARSAVLLRHDAPPDPAHLRSVIGLFEMEGLAPTFRLPDDPRLAEMADALAEMGFAPEQPTLVMTGEASALAALSEAPAEIASAPDDAWAAAFAGDGFDPEAAAARLANLSRAQDAVFASARDAGEVLAVGVGGFGEGWLGVHGLRTPQARRGRGHAKQVLAALGREAVRRAIPRAFLQVEESNSPARRLYEQAGFQVAWRYFYWA